VPQTQNPSEGTRSQRIRYIETERQFLATVPKELDFFYREMIRLTRTYTMLDDLEHYHTTRINPLARRAALQLGHFLCELGVLDDSQDVFFLNKVDVESIVADQSANAIEQTRQKAQTNKSSFMQACKHAPSWSPGAVDAATSAGKVLRGLPGSPGRATGPCFRIHGPDDFGRFPPKSVLVARTTNPAWTPLFYTAAAVITESGGPLSHGAVTAREMGLPAVMSVRGIMNIIVDGQTVTVDGTKGIVELNDPP
jgi:phosphohistidine swiveling domain-containing protein